MEPEITLGDLYEELADRLALARTKALMGEREEALGLLKCAVSDFSRLDDVLRDYPGYEALRHSLEVTTASLAGEREADRGRDQTVGADTTSVPRIRRADRAA